MPREGVPASPGAAVRALLKGRTPAPGLLPQSLLNSVAEVSHIRGRFSKLTNIERLMACLCHKEPDHVPCFPMLSGASRRLTGASYRDFSLEPEVTAASLLAAFDRVGGEAIVPMLDLSVEAADWGQEMVYPENSTPHPDYTRPLIRDVSDYRKLKKIDFRQARRMQALVKSCAIMVEKVGLRGMVSGFVFGPLGILNMMRGTEHLFRDCVNHPSDVMSALETITEVAVEYVEAQCDTGVQAMALDTLFASWNGLGKRLWEKIEGPFAREMAEAARKKGCAIAVHNCGHGLYMDAQIRAMKPDVVSFAHLPDDCSSLRNLKEKYGDQVILMGCIDTPLLCYGTPHDIMEECKKQIDVLADGGGFILAPGCEFPPNGPLENAHAIVEAARFYG